jgi:hypothetical protein
MSKCRFLIHHSCRLGGIFLLSSLETRPFCTQHTTSSPSTFRLTRDSALMTDSKDKVRHFCNPARSYTCTLCSPSQRTILFRLLWILPIWLITHKECVSWQGGKVNSNLIILHQVQEPRDPDHCWFSLVLLLCQVIKAPWVNALQLNLKGTRNQADWLAQSKVHQSCLLLQWKWNSLCAIRCKLS